MKRLNLFKNAKKRDYTVSDKVARNVLHADVEILNYRPEDYFYSSEWVDFVKGAHKRFLDTIVQAKPDELNAQMLDCHIDSHYNAVLTVATAQFTSHCDALSQHELKLHGNEVEIDTNLKLLTADLATIEKEIADLVATNTTH